ncbi:MAG: 16S rRNA (adenine(1518)-N(6)/adenine(1519)-N(6))-dimethyltransferase RsmA [Alphaproteobacteria bacterium]|nr:16S rRNA (adenine(1518)-N(6)/adenine(1519)-N(6))-dimethyltransferase RsmA [Alphaproteobacteria bacterium SS10]
MPLDLAGRQALIEDLPALREALQAEDLWARKSLGQHFLLDLNLTRRIVREAGLSQACHVVEVGPGPGGLTRALVEADVASVTAIERDDRFAALNRSLADASEGFLQVIEGDALNVDPVEAVPPPRAVVANLPYNVGTPLLVGWLKQASAYESLTLMFQKEVADRIAAAPGSKAYGRLSVLAQLCCDVRLVMTIPARAFTPPPKIDSAVVRLAPLEVGISGALFDMVEKVTAAAFGQRRKMLRASLKPIADQPVELLEGLGITPTMRADALAPGEYRRLAEALLQTA